MSSVYPKFSFFPSLTAAIVNSPVPISNEFPLESLAIELQLKLLVENKEATNIFSCKNDEIGLENIF